VQTVFVVPQNNFEARRRRSEEVKVLV